MAGPEFILMLTRADRTAPDAMDRLHEALASGVRHIGFKNIGQPLAEQRRLAEAIHAAGGTLYLEIVSLDEASERASAEAALELGVDYLLGGARPDVALSVIRGKGVRYFPFAGRIAGHPSVLEGGVAEIVDSACRLCAIEGVDGLDLLAYRYAGDAAAVIRQVCGAVAKPVIVAGSIDRPERIAAARAGGAAAFTVGTAALDEAFAARSPGLAGQIEAIRDVLAALATPSG